MTAATLENPVTGERFTFTEVTPGRLAFDFALREGGKVPIPHVHATQTERFEVVAGEVRFRLGLRSVLAYPGDVIEVPPGVTHAFANTGAGEARMKIEVTPALEMHAMFTEVVAMAHAGQMNRRGLPRNLRDLATLAHRYADEAHAPGLTARLQRWLTAPLARRARAVRRGLGSAPRPGRRASRACAAASASGGSH
jgi:quercetin dioxygenase-like cupin family protein